MIPSYSFARRQAPSVSVIIPAFRCGSFLPEAVSSILAQDYPHIEIIVAPDDGDTYRDLRQTVCSTRLRILPPGENASGPGATRNRGLDAARGDFIALCDADDLWPANYLSTLIPMAIQEGVAFCPTHYADWSGKSVRVPPTPPQVLSLIGYGQMLASLRPVLHRSMEVGYREVLAEDILHDLHVIAASGKQVALASDTHYLLRLRPGSLTSSEEEGVATLDAAYRSLIRDILFHPTRVGLQSLDHHARQEISECFAFRAWVNETYSKHGGAAGYHEFVLGQEAALWDTYQAARAVAV